MFQVREENIFPFHNASAQHDHIRIHDKRYGRKQGRKILGHFINDLHGLLIFLPGQIKNLSGMLNGRINPLLPFAGERGPAR